MHSFHCLSLLNKMENGLWYFSVLYYVHCAVFKQSKSSLTELSTIYNINVRHWFSNTLSRDTIVFCHSMSLYRMLICVVDHGLHVSSHLQMCSSKTFAFMQTAWSFTLFLLTFSTIFLSLPFQKMYFAFETNQSTIDTNCWIM